MNWLRCVYKILIQWTYDQLVRTHIRGGDTNMDATKREQRGTEREFYSQTNLF
jgi:hypothetical protein